MRVRRKADFLATTKEMAMAKKLVRKGQELEAIHKLLKGLLRLETIDVRHNATYRVQTDDNDGIEGEGWLILVPLPDEDMMVWIDKLRCRFCTPQGGGRNQRVLRALYILAESARLESSDLYDPIKEKIKGTGEESNDLLIVHELLERPFWLATLDPEDSYPVKSDDCHNYLSIYFSLHGDAWIDIGFKALRFRTGPGGGKHLLVRNGLLILAEAIRLDTSET